MGRGIEPGDILIDPTWARQLGGNGNPTPGIFIPAEHLGLETLRSFNGADELDALDVIPEPATIVSLLGLAAVYLVVFGRRQGRRYCLGGEAGKQRA